MDTPWLCAMAKAVSGVSTRVAGTLKPTPPSQSQHFAAQKAKRPFSAQALTDIFFYIEAFYNRQRRHSTLDYVSPTAYEAAYSQRQHQLALT